MKRDLDELRQLQALPLSVKILMTNVRIGAWINEHGKDDVCVLMTLSPESLVLIHLVNKISEGVQVRFDNTALKPMVSWMASEDDSQLDDWLSVGCNHYESDAPISRPMAFWTRSDILEYLNNEVTNEI